MLGLTAYKTFAERVKMNYLRISCIVIVAVTITGEETA